MSNQLVRVDDAVQGITTTYTYDYVGNILAVRTYEYTIGSLGTVLSESNYTYDSLNKRTDLSYDDKGNLLALDGFTFTWQDRRLAGAVSDNLNISYTYNYDGIRTGKTVNGITTSYTVDESNNVVSQSDGTNILRFVYDSNNAPVYMVYNGTTYYYEKNLQGDVVGLLDEHGNSVVQYSYDVWGRLLSISGTLSNTVGITNPLRYRGYYYDPETGFYSLQSRYYDPEIGRFISADDPAVLQLMQGDVLGSNLYAYCKNNPIMYKDPSGYGPVGAIIGGILGFGLGALIVPRIADLLRLKGWGRTAFIWAGVAAITALGAYVGYYVGEAIFQIYKAGGAFASKINEAIARGIAKLIGGSINSASGNGWVLKVGKLTLRIMTEGGGRVNYFRLSHATKGAMTILGAFSGDRALTHINVTFGNIIQIVATILKFK